MCAEDWEGTFRVAAVQRKKDVISNTRAMVRKGKDTPVQKRTVAGLKKAEEAAKGGGRKRTLARAFDKELKQTGIELLREKYLELPQASSSVRPHYWNQSISVYAHSCRVRKVKDKVVAAGRFVNPVLSLVNQEGTILTILLRLPWLETSSQVLTHALLSYGWTASLMALATLAERQGHCAGQRL